ncbi:pdiA, partial [Symbiodinium necroappetens]
VVQLHQPRGVWLCRNSECERRGRQTRNSSTSRTCWKCKTDRRKSGVPPPENPNPKTGLFTVVADTFEEVVKQSDAHVFIDCTADWCGPSVVVKPFIYQLAKITQRLDEIRVAMMDTVENMVDPDLFPEPYIPNMKLFLRDKKDGPIKFDGVRTLEGMIRFIEEHTGVQLAKKLQEKLLDMIYMC